MAIQVAFIIRETNTEELHTVANASTSKEMMIESLYQEYIYT